jgi:PAS domain S-box-containing protein
MRASSRSESVDPTLKRQGRLVFWSGLLVSVAAFAAIRLGVAPNHTRFLDNVYWTVSYSAAAMLAWLGVRGAAPQDRISRLWFARGFTGYAIGQVLWDIQVAIDNNPFPGPSDLFFIVLGPGCALAFWAWLRGRLGPRELRLPLLDTAMLSVAVLVLTLALYLPRRGETSAFALAVLVAYPVVLLGAASLGVVLVLTLKPRLGIGWPLLLVSLMGAGAAWLEWNSLTLDNALADGTWYNFSFAIVAFGMGAGAVTCRLEPSDDVRWERFCEGTLRLLPLFLVLVAAAGVLLVFTLPNVPEVALLSVMLGAAVVVVLAVLRQSMLLSERDRLLATEKQMRAVEAGYRTVVESASDGIFIADATGRYIDVNSRGCELLGYSREELLSLSISDVLVPRDRGRVKPEIEKLARGTVVQSEWWFLRKDGSSFTGEVSARILPDGRLQGILRDVTERRALEERVRQVLELRVQERTAELERANTELEAFAYSASHDLRTPLRAIDAYAAMLAEDEGARLSDGGRRSLDRIRGSTKRMAELVDRMLELSRVGRSELVLEALDLASLARDVADELRHAEPSHPVEFVCSSLAPVRGDRALVRTALYNLLQNAWKFTRGRSAPRVELGSENGGDGRSGYFVKDNGVGFDPELADKIFRPFQRLHRDDEFSGTGIGAAIVARVVERHGGRVWAEGNVGEGATFHFTLGDSAALTPHGA